MCETGNNPSRAKQPPDSLSTTEVTPELLSQLLDRHAAALELYARQWCRTPEDVVQHAFVQLAHQRPVPEQVVMWLFRVVRNGAISASRIERRRQRHETSAAEMARPWFKPAESSEVEAGFDSAAATAALSSLPEKQREIVLAHLWGGLTFQEIGEMLGLSASTAHRRYVASLQTMRANLLSTQ